jgi:hypothetical protein
MTIIYLPYYKQHKRQTKKNIKKQLLCLNGLLKQPIKHPGGTPFHAKCFPAFQICNFHNKKYSQGLHQERREAMKLVHLTQYTVLEKFHLQKLTSPGSSMEEHNVAKENIQLRSAIYGTASN